MIGIYKITSPTNKVYIGQSTNIEKRFSQYKNLQCKGQKALYNSLLKHSFDKHKFEVLIECLDIELNEFERYYQELFNCVGKNGLNLMMIETNTKKRVCSDFFISNLIELNKNRIWSDESKIKLGNKQRNRMFGNNYKSGFKHSQEFKDKRSEIMKGNKNTLGFKHNESTKNKMSENSTKKLLVLDKETGVFYNSIVEVANLYNLKSNTLAMKLKEYGNKKNNTNFILV